MVVEYLGPTPILYLDISSSITGYTIALFNRDKSEAIITRTGAFWFNDEDTHGLKYNKLCRFIKELCREYKITGVVAEAYFLNPYQLAGGAICPEIQGSVKSALFDIEEPPAWYVIAPNSWRAALGIKKDTTKAGVGAFKIPTKIKIEQMLNFKFPEKIKSNLNGKLRKVPFDIFDSLGVCMGWLASQPNGCKSFIIESTAIKQEET